MSARGGKPQSKKKTPPKRAKKSEAKSRSKSDENHKKRSAAAKRGWKTRRASSKKSASSKPSHVRVPSGFLPAGTKRLAATGARRGKASAKQKKNETKKSSRRTGAPSGGQRDEKEKQGKKKAYAKPKKTPARAAISRPLGPSARRKGSPPKKKRKTKSKEKTAYQKRIESALRRNPSLSRGQAAGHPYVKHGRRETAAEVLSKAEKLLNDPDLLKQNFFVKYPDRVIATINKNGGVRTARGYIVFLRLLYGDDAVEMFIGSLYGKGK